MKKSTIIIICVAVVLVLVGAVTGISLAIWQETKSKDVGIDVTPDINPSLRYQIFEPLNESGNLMTDFVEYNQAVHGALLYENKTYKTGEPFDPIDPLANYLYNIYYKSETEYSLASPAQVMRGISLFVRAGNEAYDSANPQHGYLRYNGITSRGIRLYTQTPTAEGETPIYNEVVDLRIDDTQDLFVVDREAVGGYSPYNPDTHGTKMPMTTTSTDMVLLQKNENNEYVLAEEATIIAGTGLYVYTYDSYVPGDSDDIAKYGELRYSYRAANGRNLYIYAKGDDGSYSLANNEQLNNKVNLYVCSGKIASYALVGYTGIVAELVVPSTYRGLAVTKICNSNNYAKESFANNPIITTIVIPSSIKSIADGTFANLSALNTVYFKGIGEIRLGKYCFMACSKLKTVSTDEISLVDVSNNEVAISNTNDVFIGCELLGEGS